jgi:hypothetical protein
MNRKNLLQMLVPGILALTAAAVFFVPSKAGDRETGPPAAADLTPADVRPKSGSPKLESSLAKLAELWKSGDVPRARDYGFRRRMRLRGDAVRVVTEAVVEPRVSTSVLNARTAFLGVRISAFGGRVEARAGNLIQHDLPVEFLETLASDPFVKFIRPPRRPFRQAVVSEGVGRTGADAWRNLPAYRTAAAGVCVLDAGFSGYDDLLGAELPDSVKVRSFRADGDLAADDHGTACAEIVHDMAPDADLFLVAFDTDVEEHAALDWIVRQDVGVISYSMGWYNAGAGDGTGPICADVETAAANDILWASAAGNAAGDHWDGFFADADGDGWHDFTPGDEILSFAVPAFTPVGAFLNWKDFGSWNGSDYAGTDQDYDLYLYYWTGSAWQFIDSSQNHQVGTGAWPVEEVFGFYAARNATWGMAIHRFRGIKDVRLELFSYNNSQPIEYAVAARSLIVPADSPDALSAGATDWSNDALHSYSSHGPSHAGLIKPDFTAPSGVSTSTYGSRNFFGTSASAPHLAGALALFRGKTPFRISQIRTILARRAVDLGDAGKDNLYGSGRLQLTKK